MLLADWMEGSPPGGGRVGGAPGGVGYDAG
jgi:hypothetical protein